MSSEQHRPDEFPLPEAPGRLPIVDSHLFDDLLPPEAAFELTAGLRGYREPFVGITEDGTPRTGLYRLNDTGASPKTAVAAAEAYLDGLAPHRRGVGNLPMDAAEWRLWTNAVPTWHPKGMRLERLAERDRERALAVIEASLSPAGYTQVRTAMALNENLGELIDDYRDTLTEFAYWFTVFGTPSPDLPWGWQLMGHHVDLHCVFVAGQVVLAPVFLGAEPTIGTGRFEGVQALRDETEVALRFRRTLARDREGEFLMGSSLLTGDLPPELAGPWNGRHLAGAGSDNLILPAEGVVAASLPAEQQEGLVELIRVYLDRLPPVQAERTLALVCEHFGETRFAWRGGHDDVCAFYYRIHSPVLLVEYDNHPGVFLANPEPARYHVHTIVRHPHGNDYGRDLLAQHYRLHHGGRKAG
ncbi:DUF3500 domain-containing protein [Streptomyces parvulus]|uniref:DUF3500 domain-containing protein n=1 Tax=Streptomyces parvulus TaxID=146923 RepID=A0A369UU39_9ACTN|nr:DUF3500 domain-containing protein [Streptomyces parvulus]RDD84021.1 DUF3500 domain-containing protein [Streptomyces parvulus]